jgi:hypothetical protein
MTSTKTVSVNAEELRTIFAFVSFCAPLEHSAYICLDTGKIYCHSLSAGLEEEDLETSDHYIAEPQPLHCRATTTTLPCHTRTTWASAGVSR